MSENLEGVLSAPLYTEVERRRFPDRRRLTFRTFLRSGVTPRRRGGRRRGECDGVVDWHEPDLLLLALTILLLSITDAFFTVTLLANGATEINPLRRCPAIGDECQLARDDVRRFVRKLC